MSITMRGLLWAILFICSIVAVSAQGYYADVVLDVHENGAVAISGVSNHPQLQTGTTHELTTKNKEYWLFNLTIPEQLDEFVITVRLPEGATLNYAAAKNTVSIGSESNQVILKRVGSNNSIALAAQYRLADETTNRILPYIVGIVAALVLMVSFFYVALAKKLVRKRKPTLTFLDGLPERQKEILALLSRADGKLTQKQIEDALKLPKSSVSRNIDALSRKGLITKQTQGLTNTIRLVKE